ncbi:cobalamin B12-binding domain-containing protein [Prauserella marina]|uniref:cobalamin B12-binding domain-containing protein n=1 Tax=Prauserella marina TaxID=530584 RepID=UPI001B85BFB4|nr:cobalamin-dependent protein [Prauserella marina]
MPEKRIVPAPVAVVATTPSDAHTWNLVYLQLLLEEQGFVVHNLGPCVPFREVVGECVATAPDLLVLSSVNGHGAIEIPACAAAVRARPEVAGMRIVVGGKLTTEGFLENRKNREMLSSGVDAVFSPEQPVGDFIDYLKQFSGVAERLPTTRRGSGIR